MIQVRLTTPSIVDRFQRSATRRIAGAINRTLEEAQIRGQQLIHQRLSVRSARSAQYLERLVKFERFDRATPEHLRGQMGLQSSGTGTKVKSAKILIQLATGGTFTRPADRPFFIPTTGAIGVRPTRLAPIPRTLFPSALRLTSTRFAIDRPGQQARRGAKGGILVRGKRRTFAIDPQFHHVIKDPRTYGIHQRRDRGPESETFLLWTYRTRIQIPKRYPFREEALAEARRRLPINLAGFLGRDRAGRS